ncbi:transketolase C-terminal domain-containing protein [Isoptericola sp. b441]|uniref:Transketolase C-terminal domain-containing protein n=1 Tax=Actinotalea lenta TaxID=3064654 RepID=A0ABT9DCA2_9CELL|nr:transketolase C-terminal domain-containing protein [Isoptericola sp. b441]MDO8108502.1 transketolase C-terminal domain-containing protein [Isoptericola sp. b441]
MRDAFLDELSALAREDDRVFLIVGDLGFSVIEDFAAEFPDRFLNVGVAEQTMIGVAAGLAASGYRVFVYSIGNFPTMRCLEQIRNDVCYHERSVTVVAVGAGFSYGPMGYTHHAIEDVAVMRALPRMTVLSPADAVEARVLTRYAAGLEGPCYLRLGKNGEPRLHQAPLDVDEAVGGQVLCEGDDVTVLATGSIASLAVEAADLLRGRGIAARVVSVPVIEPLPESVLDQARGTAGIVTLEEHSARGGLGSAVLETAARMRMTLPVTVMGTDDSALGRHVGTTAYMRAMNGLTVQSVADAAASLARADGPSNLSPGSPRA